MPLCAVDYAAVVIIAIFCGMKVFTFLSLHTEPKIFIFAYYFLTDIFWRHFEIILLFSKYKLSKV